MGELLERNSIKNKFEDLRNAPEFPKKNLLIELSNICNHNCIFCANRKMVREKKEIDEQLAKRLLKEAFDLGAREVGFYATGEPLVVNNLEIYINFAKKIGFDYVYITTNGALATKERVKSLVLAGLDSIKFSINAYDEESYMFIHGKNDFVNVMNNLKFAYRYTREIANRKVRVFASVVLTKYTEARYEEIKNMLTPITDEVIFVNVCNQGGLNPENIEYLSAKTNQSSLDMFETITTCKMPFNSINITCEGYLTACCVDFQNYLAIADLNYISLKEAWTAELFISFREKHLNKTLAGTLCFNCTTNSKMKPMPLNKPLSSDFDDIFMFDGEDVKCRIEKNGGNI